MLNKSFVFGFLVGIALILLVVSIPIFNVPYDAGIRCIKAPCSQGRVSLLKYPNATTIATTQLQEQISKLIEENNKLEEKIGKN